MQIRRRQVLYFLACVSGWPMAEDGHASAEPAERGAGGSTMQDAQTASPPEAASSGSLPAERVLGIGGLFFRARDPKALAEWYRSHLGIDLIPSEYGQSGWHTEAGPTAFAPFSLTTKYLGDSHQMWMVNFRVRDLNKMAAQLRAAGVEVTLDSQTYPNGRFARIHDPEQNPIELWEPGGRDALPQ